MNSWLVTALAADHILQRIRLTADLFGADINMALVAATVSQANLGHILGDPALARAWGCHLTTPPDSLRRPISAYAVASALAQPRETVRRKVKALVAEGYLRELSQGLIVAADYAAEDVGQRVGASAELTGSFCLRLADAGVPGAIALTEEGPAPDGPRMRIVALADTAFTLRFFEDLRLVVDECPSLVYLMTVDAAKFRKPVVPGDQLRIHVKKIKKRGNILKFACDARVDGATVAEAEVAAMMVPKE